MLPTCYAVADLEHVYNSRSNRQRIFTSDMVNFLILQKK